MYEGGEANMCSFWKKEKIKGGCTALKEMIIYVGSSGESAGYLN